jgi:MoaA/NifB/PqqE/SkfB family radical SAM enzyme
MKNIKIEYLSNSKLTEEFIKDVIDQLKDGLVGNKTSEEKEIIEKLISDLTAKTEGGFVIQENEYNFLSQNEKSLWTKYLIFRYKFKIYPLLKKLNDFPMHLLVELVSYCNLKCIMCFQSDPTFNKPEYMGQIDVDLFKKIVDEAVKENCGSLTMASRGEPTLHPQFGEILEYIKGKFFDIKLNTNAMLLNEEKCHQILKNGVTELVFSVDATSKEEYEKIRRNGNFEQVVNNIKQFHKIRTEFYPDSKCRTRISGVKYNQNFDTEKFMEFWKAIVDNVVCATMEDFHDTYNNKPNGKISSCPNPWWSLYIWYDGTVSPCDYDYKSQLNMGNVREKSIREVWTGEKFFELRNNHASGNRNRHIPCDRCEN